MSGGDWGVAEGHHNPIRCIKHSKRGRPPAAPLTTVSPRQPPFTITIRLRPVAGNHRHSQTVTSPCRGGSHQPANCLAL